MSWLIASTSLRKFSACLVRSDCSSSRVSLVTPSTRPAISVPKRCSISGSLTGVSSITSCSSAGGDAGGIEPVAGQDVGDRERMGDVGIAVLALLRAVRLPGEHVGGVDQAGIGLGIVGADFSVSSDCRTIVGVAAGIGRAAVGA